MVFNKRQLHIWIRTWLNAIYQLFMKNKNTFANPSHSSQASLCPSGSGAASGLTGEISNVGTSRIFIFQCDLNCSFHDPDILVSRVRVNPTEELKKHTIKVVRENRGRGRGHTAQPLSPSRTKHGSKSLFLLFYISNSLFCWQLICC